MATRHFVCVGCGYIYEGDNPPDKCPICGAPKRAFYPRQTMPNTPPAVPGFEKKLKPTPAAETKHWVCLACGHIHEGDGPPDKCPICGAPKSAFKPRQIL